MNMLAVNAFRNLFGARIKPYVESRYTVYSASASLTVPIPRAPGKLCIVITTCTGGGTATPGLLTGFTSLAGTARAANVPGVRIQYKYLNGSEAVTLASAATSATIMCAHVLLIEGAISTRVPTISTVANSADATAVTVAAPQTQTLIISCFLGDTLLTMVAPPPEVGPNYYVAGDASNVNTIAYRSGFTLSSVDLSAWAATVGVSPRNYTIAVRSA